MKICDICKQKCKKTPYGTYVIITKNNNILCLDCNKNRLDIEEIKRKKNNSKQE